MAHKSLRVAASILLASGLWIGTYAAGRAQMAATDEFIGCICGVDTKMSTLTMIPWDRETRLWNQHKPKLFGISDKTTIVGENVSSVGGIRNGKPVRSYHLTGIGPKGVAGTSFEIKDMSQCIGRRAILLWAGDGDVPVAMQIRLPYLFVGESMPGLIGGEAAQVAGADNCPCQTK